MLDAFPRTLTKLARSWSLLLEEVSQIIWRERISASHRLFRADHQPNACSWVSVSLATTLNLEWQVVAQARLNCCVSGYNSESGMTGCGLGSLELLCLWLQLWFWNDRCGSSSLELLCLWLQIWIWIEWLWLRLAWTVVSLATNLNLEWEIVAQACLMWLWSL